MGSLLLRLRTWWETADRTQRVVTIFGATFLVFLLVGTFYFASRPKMAMAFGGLTAADQGSVVSEIQKMGIPVEFDTRGNVLVPTDKLAEVRANLANAGKLPESNSAGSKDLTKISPMTSQSVEREQIKAIQESDLAKTLEFIDGVQTARVHLSYGDQSPFADQVTPPSASITIIEKSAGSVSQDQAKAIARLVANSVEGLDSKNVTVVGQNGILWDGAEEGSASGMANKKLEAQAAESRRVRREIQQVLDTAFGARNTVATVNLEMDFNVSKETATKSTVHDTPVTEQTAKETMAGSGRPGGSGSGATANTPGAPTIGGAPSEDGKYTGTQSNIERPMDVSTTNTEKAQGTVTSMAINVVVDQDKVKDPAQVESVLQGYLGAKNGADGFTYAVTAVKFDRTADAAAAKSAADSAGSAKMQQMMSLIPVGALVLVAFFVIKNLTKVAKASNVMVTATPDGRMLPVKGGAGHATMAASSAPGLAARTGSVGTAITGPDGQMLPASLEDEEEEYLDYEEDSEVPVRKKRKRRQVEIDDIEEKKFVPLEQIKKMSDEKPQVVAMLIKSWLLEERR